MRLPDPPWQYDPGYERERNAILEQTLGRQHGQGSDLSLDKGEVVYLYSSGGTRYAVSVTDAGALSVDGAAMATDADLDTHTARTDNPHTVTKAQVGLGSVPNTDATDADNVVIDDAGGHFTSGNVEGALQELAAAPSIPVGFPAWWPTATPPSGWLERDGAAVSRTTYADLFAVIGTTFGAGDGSTTFNLPDDRGRFIRGWDHGAGTDPDAASRTDRGDGTTGDNVGTLQADAFRSHDHDQKEVIGSGGSTNHYGKTDQGGDNKLRTASWDTGVRGGNETRPVNRYYMPIIKY